MRSVQCGLAMAGYHEAGIDTATLQQLGVGVLADKCALPSREPAYPALVFGMTLSSTPQALLTPDAKRAYLLFVEEQLAPGEHAQCLKSS